jgi:putative flippase GtrA
LSGFLRWSRFNLVGLLGMALQLTLLAIFKRIGQAYPLITSSLAIEITLLHNFVWHTRYTWSGHAAGTPHAVRLVRFHLSNGVISLLCNLALLPLLMRRFHVALLLANGAAILLGSMLNFSLGERWVFSSARSKGMAQPATNRY